MCAHCRREVVVAVKVEDGTRRMLSQTVTHVGDIWTDRSCPAEFVALSPVPLDATRLAEIGDLLRYQSSISFQSARAAESVGALHTAVAAVYALHHPISVPTGGGDFMENCAACGEDMDGGRACSTLRALGLSERPDDD